MRNVKLWLLFWIFAVGTVQAQEVVEQITIQVGTELNEYQDHGNIKSDSFWGYATVTGVLSGALVLPVPNVDVRMVGGIHYKWVLDPDYCAIQLAVSGDAPEQLEYLKSITKLKYGDYEFNLGEGGGDKAIAPLDGLTVLVVQQKSCAFANAVEAAYPQGSVVTISIVRQMVDSLPPQATLSVSFGLQSASHSLVPSAGGTIRHRRGLSNLIAADKSILYWVTTQLPDGSGYPLLAPRKVAVAGGTSVNELKSFSVPNWFPSGNYTARLVAVDLATGERVSGEIQFSKSID